MYKEIFIRWFKHEFKQTKLFSDMLATVEGSQWHREDNVGVHTMMAVDQYVKHSSEQWTKKEFIGAVLCAIHDIGKPAAERQEVKEATGETYNSYKGHEQLSGMLWMDYALSTRSSVTEVLSDEDIYNIGVMAQYHLPYNIGADRIVIIREHLEKFGLTEVYVRAVMSDAIGRVSDDHAYNTERAIEWLKKSFGDSVVDTAMSKGQIDGVECTFDSVESVFAPSHDVIIMVGCAGVGKSTYVDSHTNVHSMDSVRLELFKDEIADCPTPAAAYEKAWLLSTDSENKLDKLFEKEVMIDFHEKRKKGQVVVDNTNVALKRRRRYYSASKDASYMVMIMSLESNIKRVKSRTSKYVGVRSLTSMFFNMWLPLYGEVKTIHIYLGFDYER